MLDVPLRVSSELGPVATWLAIFVTAAAAVFVFYVGVALYAVLRASDAEQRKIRYQVFRDLIDLFRPRRRP